MKNAFFILALLVAPCFLAAQKLSLGLYGGSCFARQKLEYTSQLSILDQSTDFKAGFAFGGSSVLSLTKHLALRADLVYQRMGGKYDVAFTDENGIGIGSSSLKTQFDYLQIPLFVEFSAGKKLEWFANAGFGFGRLLNTSVKLKGNENGAMVDDFFTDGREKTDYSFVTSLGARLPVTESFYLTLECRGQIGLSDIKVDTLVDGRNQAISLLAGLQHRF